MMAYFYLVDQTLPVNLGQDTPLVVIPAKIIFVIPAIIIFLIISICNRRYMEVETQNSPLHNPITAIKAKRLILEIFLGRGSIFQRELKPQISDEVP